MTDPRVQDDAFQVTIMTRLARIHHLLEDIQETLPLIRESQGTHSRTLENIQEVLLQIPCLPGNLKPSPHLLEDIQEIIPGNLKPSPVERQNHEA